MTPARDDALVSAHALGVHYPGVDLLHEVDLDLSPGAQLAVSGRSGSGKTTLLLVLAGLLAPTTGTVRWPGLSPDARRRRHEIGMVFQAPSLMPELTAHENVVLPLRLRGSSRADADAAAREAMAEVAAGDVADALPWQLSGGQQQRVAVARVLAGRHRVVLADEPTGALDRVRALEVVLALRDHQRATGGALVVATHDEELAGLFPERLSVGAGAVSAEHA